MAPVEEEKRQGEAEDDLIERLQSLKRREEDWFGLLDNKGAATLAEAIAALTSETSQ